MNAMAWSARVVLGLAAGSAVGQTVYPAVRINPRAVGDHTPYYNTAIVGTNNGFSGPLDIVAATTRAGSPSEVLIAISGDNGGTFPSVGVLTVEGVDQPAMADPSVAFTRSGNQLQFWLAAGGVRADGTSGVYVAQRDLGAGSFHEARAAAESGPGSVALGRPMFSQHAFDLDLVLSLSGDFGGCSPWWAEPSPSVFRLHSPDFAGSWTLARAWAPLATTPCDFRGRGPAIAVRADGGLVIAAADADLGARGAVAPGWLNNEGRPFVVTSTDNGQHWSPEIAAIGAGSGIEAPRDGDVIAIDGGARLSYLAIARGLSGTDDVYVLFAGRAQRGSRNTDLYIAWSRDGGRTFANEDILQLTDAMLHGVDGGPGGPDQIPAGLAIDTCRGVHILWYDTVEDDELTPDVELTVHWAFIDDFGLPQQTIAFAQLTEEPFGAGTMEHPTFLGERQSLTMVQRGTGGLWAFGCFAMSRDGDVDTFVQRVRTFHACNP